MRAVVIEGKRPRKVMRVLEKGRRVGGKMEDEEKTYMHRVVGLLGRWRILDMKLKEAKPENRVSPV